VIVAMVQNIFHLKIHQNKYFLFLKIIFHINTSKKSKNIKNKNKKQNLKN
jgi:hypothetical protein